MRKRIVTFTVPQPYGSMLEMESQASGRTTEQHLLHIIGNRYDNLIRVCTCGYFIYVESDAKICATCGRDCCLNCSNGVDHRSVCEVCEPRDPSIRSFRTAGTGVVGDDPQVDRTM